MPKQDRFPLGAKVHIFQGQHDGRDGIIMSYHNKMGSTRLVVAPMGDVTDQRMEVPCELVNIISPTCQQCREEYILNDGDYLCNTCRWHLDKIQTLHSSAESV